MSNELRVLHLMTGFGGGISAFIQNKAEAFEGDNEIIFDVLTFDDVSPRFEKSILSTGGNIYKVTSPEKNIISFYNETKKIFKKLSKQTVIHSHFGMNLAIYFYFLAKINRIQRFLIHAHTSLPSKVQRTTKSKLKRVLNKYMAQQMVSCGKEASKNVFGNKTVKQNKVMHIPNSINVDEYLTDSDVVFEKEKNDAIIIGNIGRFHPQKNHEFMIEIIERLSLTGMDFKWWFIGDGKLQERVKEIVREKNLGEYVEFLGRRSDVSLLLKSMDIFVLPSLYEGLPTVAIEAQAAGTQCLLSSEITKETDLDMGLVEFIPISSADLWIEGIQSVDVSKKTTSEERLNKLVEKKFTNEASAELYKRFLKKEIRHYDI